MRTAPINRPCTVGNAAGIQRPSASDFTSFVTSPLRNIVDSDPLTRIRPRSERSINPAPPSRTASYPVGIYELPCGPPDNPATVPPRAGATPAPAGSDDKSAPARARSNYVSAPQTLSSSTHDIECALVLRVQPNQEIGRASCRERV